MSKKCEKIITLTLKEAKELQEAFQCYLECLMSDNTFCDFLGGEQINYLLKKRIEQAEKDNE